MQRNPQFRQTGRQEYRFRRIRRRSEPVKVDGVHDSETTMVRLRVDPNDSDSESILAARTATALNLLLSVRVIVVGEFLTQLHGLASDDPDLAIDDIAVAVRLTRMVNKSRDISIDIRVDHP